MCIRDRLTDRVEVKNTDVSDEELEKRIREKLSKYMGKVDVVEVDDIEIVEKVVAEKPQFDDEWLLIHWPQKKL